RVRRVTADGNVTTIAGNGAADFSGDGQSAARAALNRPQALAVDFQGNVYISDAGNHRIRKVSKTTGNIDTVAGFGNAQQMNDVTGLAIDTKGLIYAVDHANHTEVSFSQLD